MKQPLFFITLTSILTTPPFPLHFSQTHSFPLFPKMADSPLKCLCFLLFLDSFLLSSALFLKTYVVQMDRSAMPDSFTNHFEWYSNVLTNVVLDLQREGNGGGGEERIIYGYHNVFHGVAARLSEEEVEKLEEEDGVVAIFPEMKYELHTTRSPRFLGLEPADSNSAWSQQIADHDVVVGVLDTGIWPESDSFDDAGMSPVPAHWKGECETGRGFTKQNCNRKIVGARVFYRGYQAATGKFNEQLEYKSPRDQDGHGTHTAATVAGSPVAGASLLGYAYGTARGMAPGARIAAYKVCWIGGCFSSDILSAGNPKTPFSANCRRPRRAPFNSLSVVLSVGVRRTAPQSSTVCPSLHLRSLARTFQFLLVLSTLFVSHHKESKLLMDPTPPLRSTAAPSANCVPSVATERDALFPNSTL